MQNSYHKIILTVFLILITQISFASSGRRKHFLSHGSGVASFGAGETLFAAQDDPSVIQYNPSVMALNQVSAVSLSHYNLFEGSSYNSASFVLNAGKNYYIGASASNLSSGKVNIRQSVYSEGFDSSVNTWDYILSGAGMINSLGLAYGLSVKYLYFDLYKKSGGTFIADAGVSKFIKGLEVLGAPVNIRLGFSAQNFIYGQVKLDSNSDDIPEIFRLSSAFEIPVYYRFKTRDYLNLYADLKYEDEFADLHTGISYVIAEKYALRAGYYPEHFTFGFGVSAFSFSFDYCADFGEIDFIHRFGLSYKWSANKHKDELYAEAKEALNKEKLSLKEAEAKFQAAKKLYNRGQYLRATDMLSVIVVSYPDFESPLHFYNAIRKDMRQTASSEEELNFGKLTYAKGYCAYYNIDYKEALSEWNKYIHFAGETDEINEYIDKINGAMKLEALKKREEELDKKASELLRSGIEKFNLKAWIKCIKIMEKLQTFVKENNFSKTIEYHEKAKEYIDKSVAELTKLIEEQKPQREPAAAAEQPEIDEAGADKKYNEGLILYAQGRYFEAERAWELTLRLNPQHQKAQVALSKLRRAS
ncbi:MAG: hypothetical protein LBQ47_00655 [Endomicrobium sp.]|jgi:tetratricopeptide (TPR) repeat protein|nr:hypothetical protein [Endomicrobium sp.]